MSQDNYKVNTRGALSFLPLPLLSGSAHQTHKASHNWLKALKLMEVFSKKFWHTKYSNKKNIPIATARRIPCVPAIVKYFQIMGN